MNDEEKFDRLMNRLLGKNKVIIEEEKSSAPGQEIDVTLQQIVQGDIPPRIIQKAEVYLKFLMELAERIDDPMAAREFIIENRKYTFDDPDFIPYIMALIKQSREHQNKNIAKAIEDIMHLIVSTILLYD